ncbi:MAG: ribosome-binding factor A [Deltaproteobacteria bacterium RBG_13_52_11]|nr:MAG: ribosome-binding factor A [Deltaproteobacteria bacterium RBG_13_52_11]
MRFKRSEKVGDQIREEISQILLRELKDPRIGFVTITTVAVSDDLRTAKVYYSVFGGEQDKEESYEGLESAKGYIKRELGRRMRLKYMPEINFMFDDSLEYGEHIEDLLRGVKDSGEEH